MNLLSRLLAFRRRHAIEREIDDDLQFHVARATDDHIARGMPRDKARRAALVELGGMIQTAEQVRDVRSMGVGTLVREVRVAIRSLRRAPRFTVSCALTIALMTGGVTSVFAVLHGLVLRPLPYPGADRLLFLQTEQPKRFGTALELADVEALSASETFDAWGLCRLGYSGTVRDRNGDSVPVHDLVVSPRVFPIFGIDVVRGRALTPADSAPGAPPVGVIGHDVWLDVFGGDPAIVGRSFTFDVPDAQFTIVGVAEPGATVPRSWLSSMRTVWRPLRASEHASFPFTTFARVREGSSIDAARKEIEARAAALATQHRSTHAGRVTRAVPLLDRLLGPSKQLVVVASASICCVMLIGVANLVSLQLARNAARQRELFVRLALGAGRVRVLRLLLTETMLLALCGSVLGLAIGIVVTRRLAHDLPLPRADGIAIDLDVLAFAAAVAVVLGLSAGLLPAWLATRPNLAKWRSAQGTWATLTQHHVQRGILCIQTAIAVVLLTGVGLLVINLWRLSATDFGMSHASELWLVSGEPPKAADTPAQNAFWATILAQARALPGVRSASLVIGSGVATGNDTLVGDVRPSGGTADDEVRISHRRVAGSYFDTIGMPLLRGRGLLDSDGAGTEAVVVINELAGSLLWPGDDPLGQWLQWGERSGPRRVVGIVPTYPHVSPHEPPGPQMFTPYHQADATSDAAVVLLHTSDGTSGPAQAVSAMIRSLTPRARSSTRSMSAQQWRLLAADRFRLGVLGAFAGAAVCLALVGIVGLVTYTTAQRSREIAIRSAVGATGRHVIELVTRHTLLPVGAGAVLGLAGALACSRFMSGLLMRVDPVDGPTFLAAALLYLGSATIAALGAGRAALRICPTVALKED